MSIPERVNYLSALIEYDLKKRGEIGQYIKGLLLEDFKLSQAEWDNLKETHKYVIDQATRRFRELLHDPTKKEGIKRQIDAALERVNAEISANARQGHIAAGLASEGYAGGYRDALYDVLLVLNGGKPKRRDYW